MVALLLLTFVVKLILIHVCHTLHGQLTLALALNSQNKRGKLKEKLSYLNKINDDVDQTDVNFVFAPFLLSLFRFVVVVVVVIKVVVVAVRIWVARLSLHSSLGLRWRRLPPSVRRTRTICRAETGWCIGSGGARRGRFRGWIRLAECVLLVCCVAINLSRKQFLHQWPGSVYISKKETYSNL